MHVPCHGVADLPSSCYLPSLGAFVARMAFSWRANWRKPVDFDVKAKVRPSHDIVRKPNPGPNLVPDEFSHCPEGSIGRRSRGALPSRSRGTRPMVSKGKPCGMSFSISTLYNICFVTIRIQLLERRRAQLNHKTVPSYIAPLTIGLASEAALHGYALLLPLRGRSPATNRVPHPPQAGSNRSTRCLLRAARAVQAGNRHCPRSERIRNCGRLRSGTPTSPAHHRLRQNRVGSKT